MMGKWVIRVLVQPGIFFALRRLGRKFVLPILSPGLPKMADDRSGSMRDICLRLLSQLIAINEQFLCGY